jgi:PQQ-dependent catabolism-associated CXXCW motif protein
MYGSAQARLAGPEPRCGGAKGDGVGASARRTGPCLRLLVVVSALLALLLAPLMGPGPLAAETVPEPPGYRMDDFRSPVPATLAGAKVLTPDAAADLWNKNAAVFIDVYPQAPKPPNLPAGTFWRDPVHRSIEGAHWLPNVGYGALSDSMSGAFRDGLARLTGGKTDAAIVFFCLRDCWMSWNAAKRAVELGYTNVMWFSDGTDGWQELGYPLIDVKKDP